MHLLFGYVRYVTDKSALYGCPVPELFLKFVLLLYIITFGKTFVNTKILFMPPETRCRAKSDRTHRAADIFRFIKEYRV